MVSPTRLHQWRHTHWEAWLISFPRCCPSCACLPDPNLLFIGLLYFPEDRVEIPEWQGVPYVQQVLFTELAPHVHNFWELLFGFILSCSDTSLSAKIYITLWCCMSGTPCCMFLHWQYNFVNIKPIKSPTTKNFLHTDAGEAFYFTLTMMSIIYFYTSSLCLSKYIVQIGIWTVR